jgi:hypothetical protein
MASDQPSAINRSAASDPGRLICQIAGLRVAMQPVGQTLQRQIRPYLAFAAAGDRPSTVLGPSEMDLATDFDLVFPIGHFEQQKSKQPDLTLDEYEYVVLGCQFYQQLIAHQGFVLHASAVAFEQRAYLFAADCGVGKSTHAALWSQTFGPDKIQIINDDKPAVCWQDGRYWVYGTPFSGKTDLNLNIHIPLQGICLLEQSASNWIRRLTPAEALAPILQQTIRPRSAARMTQLLDLLDRLFAAIPVYRLGCQMNQEAVQLAYQTMRGDPVYA